MSNVVSSDQHRKILKGIPPPLVSYADVSKAFNNPLRADFDIIRLAASELGNWSRPHARLPNVPDFSNDPSESATIKEIKKAFSELRRWSNKYNYDSYFCAVEMVAGFCEVMRRLYLRFKVTSPLEMAKILREAQKFHYELIVERIDDSDGLHEFTEAHLDKLYNMLNKAGVSEQDGAKIKELLNEFDEHREEY